VRKRLINKSKARRKHKRRARKLSSIKLREWSLKVRGRDGFTCVSCKGRKKTHAHHMVSKYYRPQFAYNINNGITLCVSCHMGSGGVHHKKSVPLNTLIAELRLIYKLNDIKSSNIIGKKLSKRDSPKASCGKAKTYRRYPSKRPSKLTR